MTNAKQSWGEFLSLIYSTPGKEGAFSSVNKLHRILKRNGYANVTKSQIQKWLDKTYTYSIHKFRKIKYPRNPIIAKYKDHIWQADLLFFPDIASFNDRKICIFVCIDVVSRFAWGEPMINKSGVQTTKAFEKILKRAHPRKPEKLQTDKGREFYNKDFKNLMKEQNIILYSTESDMKAAIAERCIKEIKKLVYRYLTFKQTNRYIDVLQKIFDSYNNTFHSTIQTEPSNVNVSNQGDILQNLYGKIWNHDRLLDPTPKFKIGDLVRLSLTRTAFTKGYKGFWTTEVFTIDEIKRFQPYTQYRLKDENQEIVDGLFYEAELQLAHPDSIRFTRIKSIIRKKNIKGKQWVLVNWENEPPSVKKWIRADKISSV